MPDAVTEIFRQGTLEMSRSPLQPLETALQWADCPMNRIFIVLSVLGFFFFIPELARLVPSLMSCVGLYRANLTLEHSVSKARSRNALAAFSAVPFCLVVSRYGLAAPSFWENVSPVWNFPATLGVLASFVLLRAFLYVVVRPKRFNSEELAALRHSLFNYFILLTCLAVITVLLSSATGMPDNAIRTLLYVESGLVLAVALLRTTQFFASNCNGFSTFLYLCALELVPLGALIFFCTR